MIKIYFIVDINGLVYVGSTKGELNIRFSYHKYNKKIDKNCSSKLLDLDNSIIETIEECTEDNRKTREQYWINNIECVNKYNAFYDKKKYDKEWEQQNKEKRKQYKKEYYQNKKNNLNFS